MSEKTPKYLFIVDEGPVYSELLGYIFTKDFSYRFLNYKTGEETLSNLDLEPEVIVLSSRLKDMAGMAVLKEIRKKMPHIFVLVLLSDEEEPADWFAAGADDFMRSSEMQGTALALQIENQLTRDTLISGVQRHILGFAGTKVYYFLLGILVCAAFFYSI
jgi:DNA-binding response OmpR family regulator